VVAGSNRENGLDLTRSGVLGVTDPLSPADRANLAAERGAVNMAIAGVVLVEAGPGVTYDAICRRIQQRVHLIPRYRQRIEQPVLGLANPVWVDDEDFDVEWHVRLAKLPPPGGDSELADYVSREAARLMDRSRPLWELHVVEGLAGNRVAIVPKMHHALVDGLGAMGVGMILLDPSPDPEVARTQPAEWKPQPYDVRRHLTRIAASSLQQGLRLAMQSADRVLDASPRTVARDVRRATDVMVELARSRAAAPSLPLNRSISANRSYAMTSASLSEMKSVGKAAGASINDVILAAVAGMLARWLKDAGVKLTSLPRDPVALVPVNVRAEDGQALGNRISIVLVDLPVRERQPRRRIELIHDQMQAIKNSPRVAAGALMLDLTGFVPPLLSSALARVGGGASTFNLVVSNVPGPQFPLYMGGSRVLAVHPVVPLNPADQGLNVGVFSYDGSAFFGMVADRELYPPLERAHAALNAALSELTL
jgi:WS/DGAT/MGAT family acyltransferase